MRQSLSTIQPGTSVCISGIQDSALKPKLMEMGLLRGKELKVLFKAPFGDPIAIEAQGFVLSLRLDEANLIEVESPLFTAVPA
jgi:Fe2+ transport system protein FeoA